MADRRVFDTSAVLAVLFMEPGGDQTAALWADGDNLISAVNYAELVSKLNERGVPDAEISTILEGVPLDVVSLDAATAHAAGLLRLPTQALGLSLGDRACLALGAALGAQVVTADRVWAQVPGFHGVVVR